MMGAVVRITDDPLLGGFYTVSDAARLLGIENRKRIYRWLSSPSAGGGAVVIRDYLPIGKFQELSFWDLIEIRFVEHFRSQDVSLQFLRKVATKAREQFKQQHPFALSSARFLTDRKRIFEQTAAEEGGRKTVDFLSGQYEMYETIEEVLAKGIAFDPQTALAQEWRPLRNDCPRVVLNPRYAFGRPVIGDKHVPTEAIYRQWRAEKGNKPRVANWYGVSVDEVEEAVEFEVRLAA